MDVLYQLDTRQEGLQQVAEIFTFLLQDTMFKLCDKQLQIVTKNLQMVYTLIWGMI
jgi:hypothetical protein